MRWKKGLGGSQLELWASRGRSPAREPTIRNESVVQRAYIPTINCQFIDGVNDIYYFLLSSLRDFSSFVVVLPLDVELVQARGVSSSAIVVVLY